MLLYPLSPEPIVTELTFLGSEPWSVIAWYAVGGEELAHSTPEKVDTAWGDFWEHGCVRQLLSEPCLGDNSHPSVSYLLQKTPVLLLIMCIWGGREWVLDSQKCHALRTELHNQWHLTHNLLHTNIN